MCAIIKEWFANYFLHNSDVTIDIGKNEIKVLNKNGEDWKDWGLDNFVLTPMGAEGIKQSGIKEKIIKEKSNDAEMIKFAKGVWDIADVFKSLNNQITECINRYKNK